METVRQILFTFRDLLIPYLPKFIVRWLVGRGDFVFIAHVIHLDDIAKKYPFAKLLPKKYLKILSRHLWTVIGSKITGFKLSDGRVSNGWIIFCPLSTKIMLLNRNIAEKKVIEAVKFAEKLSPCVLGLGAFVPIVSADGKMIEEETEIPVVTGSGFSAAIAAENILEASKKAGLETSKTTLAIVGACGSVGSMCLKIIGDRFKNKILVDKNLPVLQAMKDNEFKEDKTVIITDKIEKIKEADIILAVTNVPGVVVRAAHLKSGAIVIDAAQPKNVSAKVPVERDDVLVIESGIAEAENVQVNFDLGLKKPNEVYSCLAEMLILLWLDDITTHVGEIDFNYVNMLMNSYRNAGIKLADFRNSLGLINEKQIRNISKVIALNS